MGLGGLCGVIISFAFVLKGTISWSMYALYGAMGALGMFTAFFALFFLKEPNLKHLHEANQDGDNFE